MSILLPRYSGFPPEIFERGLVPQMTDSAIRLYLFLCRTSDRRSSLRFTTTDREINEQAGVSPRSLRNARINLKSLGLIHCEKAPGGNYCYSLCDASTGQPFPGDPKSKARYVKRDRQHSTAPNAAHRAVSGLTVARADPAPEEADASDISFSYGHNAESSPKVYFPLDAFDDPR